MSERKPWMQYYEEYDEPVDYEIMSCPGPDANFMHTHYASLEEALFAVRTHWHETLGEKKPLKAHKQMTSRSNIALCPVNILKADSPPDGPIQYLIRVRHKDPITPFYWLQ